MCKYCNCEYYINIYIFVPWDLLHEHSSEVYVTYEASDELVAGNSACVKLCFFIFCCKFYEKLFAVWRRKKKTRCRIGMGRGLERQPVSHVYLLHNKCMKKEKNGNKAILHTSINGGFLCFHEASIRWWLTEINPRSLTGAEFSWMKTVGGSWPNNDPVLGCFDRGPGHVIHPLLTNTHTHTHSQNVSHRH